jgi:hypothetical protein
MRQGGQSGEVGSGLGTGRKSPNPNHGRIACDAPAARLNPTKLAADGTCAMLIDRTSHGAALRSGPLKSSVNSNANGNENSGPDGATTSALVSASGYATDPSVAAKTPWAGPVAKSGTVPFCRASVARSRTTRRVIAPRPVSDRPSEICPSRSNRVQVSLVATITCAKASPGRSSRNTSRADTTCCSSCP